MVGSECVEGDRQRRLYLHAVGETQARELEAVAVALVARRGDWVVVRMERWNDAIDAWEDMPSTIDTVDPPDSPVA